jgi:flavin-binding protein dodecin
LTGTSSESVEAAVQNAVKRAHKTLKNLSWFEVVETRGRLASGKIEQWQVTIKVGFALET